MLDFLKQKPIIEFYTHPDMHGVIPVPKSAGKCIPDWFKKIPQELHTKDRFNNPAMTAKKCLPLLDAMTLGYVIPLAGDTRIKTNHDCSMIKADGPPNFKTVEFHSVDQIGGKSGPGFPAPPVKFINRWVIKTRPGWSVLILPVINDINNHFTCLAGVVDTDKYPKEINFPAIWHTPNFEGSFKAGTPLVTVIPFKRNSFPKDPIIRKMTDAEFKEIGRIDRVQGSRISYYTKELRDPR